MTADYTNTACDLLDQPRLGLSSDKLVLNVDEFTGSVSGGKCSQNFTQDRAVVIDRSALLAAHNGDTLPETSFTAGGQQTPSLNADTLGGGQNIYLPIFTSNSVVIDTLTGHVADNSVTRTASGPSTIAGLSTPPTVAQALGAGFTLDAGEVKPQSVSYRNGTLWVTSADACKPGTTTVACARVLGFNTLQPTAATLIRDTDLSLATKSGFGPDAGVLYPAIITDQTNNIYVAASSSSSTTAPGGVLFSSTAADQFSSSTVLEQTPIQTSGPLKCTDNTSGTGDCRAGSNSVNRFGDYSGIAVDDNDPGVVLSAAEAGNPTSPTVPTDTTSTEIFANAFTPAENSALFTLADGFPAAYDQGPVGGSFSGGALSDDGRYVAFASDNPAGTGPAQVFRKDLTTGALDLVSDTADGPIGAGTADSGVRPVGANNWYRQIAISGDGRYVAFTSMAQNLTPGLNGKLQVFRKDMSTGGITLMSITTAGVVANQAAGLNGIDIMDNGRAVVFSTMATNLLSSDTNGHSDVYAKSYATHTVYRYSVSNAGAQADNGSINPQYSGDGGKVLFYSSATNLVAGDGAGLDWFVRNTVSPGSTTEVSKPKTTTGRVGPTEVGGLSKDGDWVIFQTPEAYQNTDTNGVLDTYVFHLSTGGYDRVSLATPDTQQAGTVTEYAHQQASVSNGGRYAEFYDTHQLDPNSTGGGLFVRDRQAHTTHKLTNPGRGDRQILDGLNGADMTPTGSYCTLTAGESYSPFDTNAILDIYRTPCATAGATLAPHGN